MAVNFSHAQLGTKIFCSTVAFEDYLVDNLITSDIQKRSLGFLAGSFIRPPLDVLLQFPCSISICCLVVDGKVGIQHSLGCEVLIQNESPSGYDPFNHGTFRLVGKYFWDAETKGFHLTSSRHTEQCRSISGNDFVKHVLTERVSGMLNGVRTLRLRIVKTSGSSVPALKSVQVCGYVAYNCDPDSARSVLQKWFDIIKDRPVPQVRRETVEAPKDEPVTLEDNLEVPEEFLDSLTCEIMALPVRLPSGNVVDERTLERFTQQEAAWGRSASDPFTGQVFDVHRKPLYDTALKARIDAFLMQHNNRKCLQNVGRTVGAITKRSSELLVAKYDNGTRPVPYYVDTKRTSMSTHRPLATPSSSSSPLSQAVDQSRRLLANLATAQRHISRGQPTKTAVPSSTSASSTPSTTGQTPVPTCWCGQTDGLYVLPCTHHICRPCLLRLTNADRNQDLQCQHCRQSFSTQEPVRLHNASAKASGSSP